jgi:hypothetical protein
MRKRKTQKPSSPRKGEFTESQKKFIREFARETAIAAREIFRGAQEMPVIDFEPPPEELAELAKVLEAPAQRDRRGRFVRRS